MVLVFLWRRGSGLGSGHPRTGSGRLCRIQRALGAGCGEALADGNPARSPVVPTGRRLRLPGAARVRAQVTQNAAQVAGGSARDASVSATVRSVILAVLNTRAVGPFVVRGPYSNHARGGYHSLSPQRRGNPVGLPLPCYKEELGKISRIIRCRTYSRGDRQR